MSPQSTSGQPIVLELASVEYFHENDETAFFGWLDRMTFVEKYWGQGRSLSIQLRAPPGRNELMELIAFYFRYRIEMHPLIRFETRANKPWLTDPGMFWHAALYGEAPPSD